jgi:hypothetical protein
LQYETARKRKPAASLPTRGKRPPRVRSARCCSADCSVVWFESGWNVPLVSKYPTPPPWRYTHRGAGVEVDVPVLRAMVKVWCPLTLQG